MSLTKMVPVRGLEPPWSCDRQSLSNYFNWTISYPSALSVQDVVVLACY